MKNILIVEDDRAIGELERDYLEACGYRVTCLADGRKGRELALAGDFDGDVFTSRVGSLQYRRAFDGQRARDRVCELASGKDRVDGVV